MTGDRSPPVSTGLTAAEGEKRLAEWGPNEVPPLGEPSRLLLLSHLLEGELSVQDLADATGLTQTTTSRQLAVLRAERIVARKAEGKRALYRVADGTIAALCRIVCGGLEKRLTNDLRSVAPTGPGRYGRRRGIRR